MKKMLDKFHQGELTVTIFLVTFVGIVQSNPVNTDIDGPQKVSVLTGCCIKRVDFKENARAFFAQVQSKLSVIMRCLYLNMRVSVKQSGV